MENKRRLKVAILSFYSGAVNRGVESFAEELATKLVLREHEVIVCQQGPVPNMHNYRIEQVSQKVDWTRGDTTDSFLRKFFIDYWSRQILFFTIKAIVRVSKDRPDIVIPLNGGFQSLFTRIYTLVFGVKMVCVGQSGPGRDDRVNINTFPDTFVALTDHQTKWAKRVNPFVKLATIPNGVDLDRYYPSMKSIETSLARPVILNVSAMVDWKRQDLVVKAVARLKKGSLLIVGKGEVEPRLRELCEKLIPGRYQIKSFSYTKMPSVYTCADVFVFPTVPWESFGIVLLEAMASGLPIVATEDPIRREIVGEAGLYVNPVDDKRLAESIERVLRKKWGDLPRMQAEKFSWEKVVDKYEKLFIELTE